LALALSRIWLAAGADASPPGQILGRGQMQLARGTGGLPRRIRGSTS